MYGCKTRAMLKAVLSAVFVFCVNIHEIPANELQITVLVSHNESPYTEVLAGFQEHIVEQKIPSKCTAYALEGGKVRISHIFEEIKRSHPAVIFTIGTFPTVEALKVFHDIPVVATFILDEDTIKRSRNATGVILDFPLEKQFFWLKQFLPKARKIGVIYNPLENQEKIRCAEEIARKMGLELYPVKVHTPKDIPRALKTLANEADVLWGMHDALIFNSLTARHILLFSFRNRIPFCGLSSAWVKAGALYALEYDFHDIGMQCGEMVVKITGGAQAKSVPPSFPRKLLYTVNLRTARHMKVDIKEEYIRTACKIFDE